MAAKRSALASPADGPQATMRPSANATSISCTVSWTKPWRKDVASMPMPATAPPTVMDLSCGTTRGITPWGSVASTKAS